MACDTTHHKPPTPNPRPQIGLKEIKHMLGEFYAEAGAGVGTAAIHQKAEAMLKYADTNHDGSVSRAEFEALLADVEYICPQNVACHWAGVGRVDER